MLVTPHKMHDAPPTSFHIIIMLSAWGFALVVVSFLFLWLGHLLDELLGTKPIFMLGLFLLGIVGCFIKLFEEAWQVLKNK
jgi:F0F1-type ATP synthase assembly protein I